MQLCQDELRRTWKHIWLNNCNITYGKQIHSMLLLLRACWQVLLSYEEHNILLMVKVQLESNWFHTAGNQKVLNEKLNNSLQKPSEFTPNGDCLPKLTTSVRIKDSLANHHIIPRMKQKKFISFTYAFMAKFLCSWPCLSGLVLYTKISLDHLLPPPPPLI